MISLIDDPDMGVTLSVTSLIMALAQDRPDEYKGSYVKAAQRLKKIIVDNDISPDYLYYKVPCPWIQVKLLRLLQYFPPSGLYFYFTFEEFTDNCVRGYSYSRPHPRVITANITRSALDAEKCTTK